MGPHVLTDLMLRIPKRRDDLFRCAKGLSPSSPNNLSGCMVCIPKSIESQPTTLGDPQERAGRLAQHSKETEQPLQRTHVQTSLSGWMVYIPQSVKVHPNPSNVLLYGPQPSGGPPQKSSCAPKAQVARQSASCPDCMKSSPPNKHPLVPQWSATSPPFWLGKASSNLNKMLAMPPPPPPPKPFRWVCPMPWPFWTEAQSLTRANEIQISLRNSQ